MDLGLKGKTVLITGGARGIGGAIAGAFAREKANLAIIDIEPGQDDLFMQNEYGIDMVTIKADVKNEDEVKRSVQKTVDTFGSIDIFVNAAGVLGYEAVTKITLDEWRRIIDTNLTGAMLCCREVCKHMIEKKSGSIVVITSTIQYMPAYREAAYRASKTGLQVFTETVALEMAPFGIRVNTVSPGIIYSEHWSKNTLGPVLEDKVLGPRLLESIPLGRTGKPEDIGDTVAFISSDRCPYMTGTNIILDGGFHLRPLILVSNEEIREMNCLTVNGV
jgi:NAD(P)-dependent dehydrogenase (short-subunit alcohol dehydrogenase family)